MLKNEIYGWALKLLLICVIGFVLFCLGRFFNHFPKHEEKQRVEAVVPAEVEIFEAVKTAGNTYEIVRRVR